MTDYSTSNLGGIRNRHLPADAPILPDDPPKRRRREKQQLEIAGAERPTIIPIDDAVRALLDVEAQIVLLKEQVKSARAEVEHQLMEHALVTYLYVDGAFEYPVKIDVSTKLVVKKRKRRTEEDVKHDTNDGASADRGDR